MARTARYPTPRPARRGPGPLAWVLLVAVVLAAMILVVFMMAVLYQVSLQSW